MFMREAANVLNVEGVNASDVAIWRVTVEGPAGAGEQAHEIAMTLWRALRGFHADLLLTTAIISEP